MMGGQTSIPKWLLPDQTTELVRVDGNNRMRFATTWSTPQEERLGDQRVPHDQWIHRIEADGQVASDPGILRALDR